MIKDLKICGVSDPKTLNYILNHPNPPKFIGFITNYKKSKRYIEYSELNQQENMIKGMINEVTGMFASYFRQQLGGGLPLPVELTLRYAMGNMDPLTNSPGTLYNAITMKSIVSRNQIIELYTPNFYNSVSILNGYSCSLSI